MLGAAIMLLEEDTTNAQQQHEIEISLSQQRVKVVTERMVFPLVSS